MAHLARRREYHYGSNAAASRKGLGGENGDMSLCSVCAPQARPTLPATRKYHKYKFPCGTSVIIPRPLLSPHNETSNVGLLVTQVTVIVRCYA